MLVQTRQSKMLRSRVAAFTIVEVLMAITILTLVVAGLAYGYSQANRLAEWSSMSAAAQSYALQGMEQARAAQWNPWDFSTNTGPWSENQIVSPSTNVQWGILDVPIKGDPTTNNVYYATNYIYVTTVSNTVYGNFYLRQIRSDCVWRFPLNPNVLYTNTVITLRASDQ